MSTKLGSVVEYQLPFGNKKIDMNNLIHKKIKLHYNGQINDIHDGSLIKKSYAGGYSYKNFIKLAQCDTCIVKPELCHYDKGTCREPEWGEAHCMIPHYIYLANTSGLKVGITRHTQIPTRWIDQGATQALPILKVHDRKTSGLIEVEIAKTINDKTNWRKMLSIDDGKIDLESEREKIFDSIADILDDLDAEDVDQEVTQIQYPLKENPPKLTTLSFDKTPTIEGLLLGIKGQYLVLDIGVLNIRKHNGYYIQLSFED